LQRWVAWWLGDVDVSNPEGDLAEGGHVDLLGRRVVDFKCCGDAGVCPDIESFHSSEFAPFSDRVLVSFDALPCQEDWKSWSDFEDFVDDVTLRAKACTGKDGGCGESSLDLQDEALVVGGNSDPGCILCERRERDVKELAAGKRKVSRNTRRASWLMPLERRELANHPAAVPLHSQRKGGWLCQHARTSTL
jgi:hypothetical protein